MTFEDYPDTLYSDTITVIGARPTPTVDILIDDFESPQRAYNTFTEGQQSYNSTSVNYSGTSPAEKTRFLCWLEIMVQLPVCLFVEWL